MSIERHIMPTCFLSIEDRDWRMLVFSTVASLWSYNGTQWFANLNESLRELAIFHSEGRVCVTADELVKWTTDMLSANRDVLDIHLAKTLPIENIESNIVKLLPTSVITKTESTILEDLKSQDGIVIVEPISGS